MIFIVANTRLTSARVFQIKPKAVKTISYRGLYYEYLQQKAAYSLEFFFAQVQEIAGNYEMVFVQSQDGSKWAGCFLYKDRKSVIIDNDVFEEHLKRYYYASSGKIAIVNNIVNLKLEGIDFVSVEKVNKLINPKEQKKQLIKNTAMLSFASLFWIASNVYNNYTLEEASVLQTQISSTNQEAYENLKYNKSVSVPGKKEQEVMFQEELAKVMKQ
ncbi:MAG: hypothetical protein QG567_2177 [Campylobacterota bacterium]|nr:hypothetical protein [Campylobacterota bacterium]